MREAPRIFLWAPEFTARPGGVQQYTREVVRALGGITERERVLGLAYDVVGEALVRAGMGRCVSVAAVPRAARGAAFALRAIRECRRFRPDLILSTFPRFAPAGCLCGRLFNIPFITAAHGVEIWGRQPVVVRRSLACVDRILAVSGYTARRMIAENGVRADRVSVLSNCVDGSRFGPGPRPPELASRLRIDAGDRVLLTVARLDASERAKGVETVLRALAAIRQSIPRLVYVVAGDGGDRPRLESIARDEGVADAVRFVGRVSDGELARIYRLCDCFVMPSSKEGFGIVFLEAMATGKPVIAGDRDGAREPLRDGELGWLVDPDLPGEVARAVGEAIGGTAAGDRRRDGGFLREQTLAHFGQDVFRENLHKQIFSAIDR